MRPRVLALCITAGLLLPRSAYWLVLVRLAARRRTSRRARPERTRDLAAAKDEAEHATQAKSLPRQHEHEIARR